MKSARPAYTPIHIIVLTGLMLLLCGTSVWSEDAGTATPYMTSADRMADPTPKAWAMGHAAEAHMDYASGTATIGMDLMSWKVGSYTMSLGLQYQLRAYKCREESGWVGLGWSLTGTGVITRTIAGLPDEFRGYDCRNHNDVNDDAAGREYLRRIEEKEVDAQLDRYSYSFPGGSGQFVILKGKIVQLPQSDNAISAYGSDAAGVSTFVITTPDGTKYEYAKREKCEYKFVSTGLNRSQTSYSYEAATAWHLTKIVLPEATDEITFEYVSMNPWVRSSGSSIFNLTIFNTSDIYCSLPRMYLYGYDSRADLTPSSSSRLKFLNPQIISKISSRTGTVVFEHETAAYRQDVPRKFIKSITLSNPNGREVVKAGFSAVGTRRRKLSGVTLTSGSDVIDTREFSYHSEASGVYDDFFGYNNNRRCTSGKRNVVERNGSFADCRHPDADAARADAMHWWRNMAGLKTTVTYEASKLPDMNFQGGLTVEPRNSTGISLPPLTTRHDTVVGLRLKSIEVTDSIAGTVSTRTFTYDKPRSSIDFKSVRTGEFLSLAGYWTVENVSDGGIHTRTAPGLYWWWDTYTTLCYLPSSKTPGVSPEHAVIYYGEVCEDISGTNLASPVRRRYLYDTSDCVAELVQDGVIQLPQTKTPSIWEDRNDLRPILNTNYPISQTYNPTLFGQAVGMYCYRHEKIGSAPRLISRIEYTKENGIYNPLLRTDYVYQKVDSTNIPVGTYHSAVVRQQKRQFQLTKYEYESIYDFSFVQAKASAWRNLLRSETTTRYFGDGSERTATCTYHYTGDTVSVTTASDPQARQLTWGSADDIVIDNPAVMLNTTRPFNPFGADSLNGYTRLRLPIGRTLSTAGHTVGSYTALAAQSKGRFCINAGNRGLRALPLAQLTVRDGDSTLTRHSYRQYSVGGRTFTRPAAAELWLSGNRQSRRLISHTSFGGYNRYGLPTQFKATGSPYFSYVIDGLDQVTDNTLGSGDMSLTSRYTYLPLIGCETITQPDNLERKYGYDGVRLTSVTGRDSLLISYNYLHHNRVVRSSQYFIESTPSVADAYTDAAGRAMQTVRYAYGAGCGTDVVEGVTHYDALGRPIRKYQPVAMDWQEYDYALKSDIIESCSEELWGADTPYAYTALSYPASAQTQPKSTVLPGSDMAGHASTAELTCSSTSDAARKIRRFSFRDGRLSMGQLYDDGELDCTATTDADGRRMWMFTDWEGKNILRRQESENNVYADTYFVYDSQGRLTVVLPPIASKELTDGSLTCAQAVAKKAYIISYDYRSRPVATKRPACAEVRTAYDGENRAVFTRDGSQLAKGRRTFNVYDSLNRVVITGTCLDSDPDRIWVSGYNVPIVSCGHAGKRGTGFCNTGYTLPAALTEMLQDARILNVFYYDGYTHLEQPAAPSNYNDAPKGRQTGSLTAVLGEGYTDKLVGSDIYYDLDGNVLRSTSELYRGGSTQIDTEYNPYGLPLKERHTVKTYMPLQLSRVPELKTFSYTLSYTHDRHGRTTATALNYLGRDYKLSEVKFDSLGRVSTVTSQGDIVRSTQYDQRGMVKAWSTPAVSQQLKYTDGTVPSYTGRVSSKITDAGAQFHSRYDYSYDKLGRLVAANQQDIDAADADFSTSYAYDLESNITRLQRRGKTAPTQYGLINDITATYNCGQITGQVDECETGTYEGNLTLTPNLGSSIQPTGPPTFNDRGLNPCSYDADGRLTKDPSRGIANIVYNEIGMPQKVLFNNGAYIGYVYLANGKKVEQKTAASPLTLGQFSKVAPVSTIYDEAFEISLGTIQRLNVPGGYVTPRDSVFHLYVPDYQGNNVAVINTATGQAEQLTDYYPYGQPINNGLGASVNPYKYGGKELLTANGYNASDFAARWLSHSLPGFQSPDPHTEKTPHFSMYAYCGGDPVNCIDSTGKDIVILYTDKVATGHMGMLIQDTDRKWYYYSINGNNLYVSGKFYGGRTFNDVHVGGWDTPEEFMKSNYNSRPKDGSGSTNKSVNNFDYQYAYRIKTSPEQDRVMRDSFNNLAKTKYSLVNNNCAIIVQKVMIDANIKVANPEFKTYHVPDNKWLGEPGYDVKERRINIIPKNAFESIREANKGDFIKLKDEE